MSNRHLVLGKEKGTDNNNVVFGLLGPRWARRRGQTTKIAIPQGLGICYFSCLWPSGGPGGQGEGDKQQNNKSLTLHP